MFAWKVSSLIQYSIMGAISGDWYMREYVGSSIICLVLTAIFVVNDTIYLVSTKEDE